MRVADRKTEQLCKGGSLAKKKKTGGCLCKKCNKRFRIGRILKNKNNDTL